MINNYEIPITVILDILKTYKYQGRYMNFKKFLLKEIGIEKDTGVYALKNKVARKLYIGSTVELSKRIRGHINMLKKEMHHSPHLQYAWSNSLPTAFSVIILEVVENESLLIEREQYWMDYYQSYDRDRGYNISPTAGNSTGVKMSEKAKAKMSLARKGKKFSSEHRMKIGIANKDKKRSQEVIAEMSRRNRGIRKTEEQKKKISESCKGKNTGKRSPDFCTKVSVACLGRKASNRKLTEENVIEIRKMLDDGIPQRKIAAKFNVSKHLIYLIYHGKAWYNLKLEAKTCV